MILLNFSLLMLFYELCWAQKFSNKGVNLFNKTFNYNIYKYDTWINFDVNNTVLQILDFAEDSANSSRFPTRIEVTADDALSVDYPLFVTATQQKGVSSWELPLVVQANHDSLILDNMARTLCPHDAGPNIKTENRPTLQLSTSSPNNVSVSMKLNRVQDFYIEVDKEIQFNVTPSSPKYYFFSFDNDSMNKSEMQLRGMPSFKIPKSIILLISSEDELCASISIQNNSCPVFDDEKEIMYKGYHLTMSSKGGITLTQSMFPTGFYVVFIVKESDVDCLGASETANESRARAFSSGRTKNFRFKVIATISYKEYVVGAVVALALVLLLAAAVCTITMLSCKCTEEVVLMEEEPIASTSRADDDDDPDLQEQAGRSGEGNEETWSQDGRLTVGKLTRAPIDSFARRSDRYFWGALTVAVVYALPVVQLLFTYQRIVYQTGDQDLCYYNFLCSHPLGFLSDFNHVFSNVGYILLGGVFALQVWRRQRRASGQDQNMGIPQHYGLLYSMALALSMEGLLSGCYHLCPNKMNFQFDSSFMYVIAVLVMLKLYQNRHSDLVPTAHATFMLLALVMTVGLCGILYPSLGFSIFFLVLHLVTCFVLTLKIYYAGRLKMEGSLVGRAYSEVVSRGVRAALPAHRARAALLAIANVANWTFAIHNAYVGNKDFARALLAILMGNAVLYTMFYFVMKLVHGERIPRYTWTYCLFALVSWSTALYFFLHSTTKWSETPAHSRRHNAACSLLEFFDSHDAWHALSAAALFLSFNSLLTVDDAVSNTRRDRLPTF